MEPAPVLLSKRTAERSAAWQPQQQASGAQDSPRGAVQLLVHEVQALPAHRSPGDAAWFNAQLLRDTGPPALTRPLLSDQRG
jgi:hypothetical protein